MILTINFKELNVKIVILMGPVQCIKTDFITMDNMF